MLVILIKLCQSHTCFIWRTDDLVQFDKGYVNEKCDEKFSKTSTLIAFKVMDF